MKYQQVSVDCVNMVFTAITYLALAGAGWIFLRLLQACFWLPKQLKKQNDIQQMLQDKVDSYEKYILECEEKEKAAAAAAAVANQGDDDDDDGVVKIKKNNGESMMGSDNEFVEKPIPIDEKKWKERRECLEMLKKELKRVRDGGDMYDWDCLLEDDEKEEKKESEQEEEEKVNDDDDDGSSNSAVSKEELNEKLQNVGDDKEKKFK